MHDPGSTFLFQRRGILNKVVGGEFRRELPAILDTHRNENVCLLVTTLIDALDNERGRHGNLFRPVQGEQPLAFTWKAMGRLHAVVRQFRLDFLRQLGQAELRCEVMLEIWPAALQTDQAAPAARDPDSRPRRAPDSPEERPRREGPGRRSSASYASARRDEGSPVPLASDESVPDRAPAPDLLPSARIIDTAQGLAQAPDSPPAAGLPPRQPITGTPTRPPLPGNLYQDFFGFECMPFNNTPDPHFFFPTTKHREALSRLVYAISERKGFILISGEIGSGKSTLCRTLLTQIPGDVKTALITHTHLDRDQLFHAIAEDLGLEAGRLSGYDTLQVLNQYLIEQLAESATVCIIIDEAQNLSVEALEGLRMVSNLETEREKLIQLILIGQPELRETIRRPDLVQLRQRIAVQFHLEPLSRSETFDYVRHRLKIANPTERLVFTRGALAEVYAFSGGTPRLVNTLCDNSLLTAFTAGTLKVTARHVREAAADLDLDARQGGWASFFKLW